jgi:hypothetical protein
MKTYMIQYPIAHPNYGELQRPIAYNNNLVKNNVCTTIKQGGVAMSKILRVCSRGGVPQAYPAPKKGDYNGCESKNQWSNLQRSHRQGQQLSRNGDQNKLFHDFITSLWPIKQLSPLGGKCGRCIVKSS